MRELEPVGVEDGHTGMEGRVLSVPTNVPNAEVEEIRDGCSGSESESESENENENENESGSG